MRLAVSSLLLLAGLALAIAQITPGPVGSTIKGFTLPHRDAQGELQANITGVSAKVVSVNRTEITGLRIELFEGGVATTSISSPQSELWNQEARLTTRSGVVVQRAGLTVAADLMEWELNDKRAVLRQNVKVTIENLDFGASPRR